MPLKSSYDTVRAEVLCAAYHMVTLLAVHDFWTKRLPEMIKVVGGVREFHRRYRLYQIFLLTCQLSCANCGIVPTTNERRLPSSEVSCDDAVNSIATWKMKLAGRS